MAKKDDGLTYAKAGVDIDAGNALVRAIAPLAAATKRPGSMGSIGGFGGLFDLKAAGFKDPVLVAANDGVGTKLKIAIETGNHDTIGIDLVAMCVNDLVIQGAEPLFFLDYFACGKLDTKTAERVISGIAEGCKQAGAALMGGETAEMPGMYRDGDYDLGGFAVGAVERDEILPRGDIAAGDTLIGLASSGVHSNGYSLVRKLVETENLAWNDPAPFEPSRSLADEFLTPTRIYTSAVLRAIRETEAVKALAHITGGGLPENLPRVLPKSLGARIDLEDLKLAPVFAWLRDRADISDSELLRTFNCGVGMVLVVARDRAGDVRNLLEEAGETAFLLGEVEESDNGIRMIGELDMPS